MADRRLAIDVPARYRHRRLNIAEGNQDRRRHRKNIKMAHGGKRPNAGRPKGAHNKASIAREAKIAAEGDTPLEVMIAAMRAHVAAGELDKAAERAKDAAPYVHPRLTAVEHSGKGGQSIAPVLNVFTGSGDDQSPPAPKTGNGAKHAGH